MKDSSLRDVNAAQCVVVDDANLPDVKQERVMQFWNKSVILTAFVGIIGGALLASGWYRLNYPMQPLFVEISNQRTAIIPLLSIEHGSDYAQEKILLTQLRPGETRVIALNHEPGRGYSIEAQLADGSKVEACVGKLSKKWVNSVLITSNGIFGDD